MTAYVGSPDGMDVEITVPRPLAVALLARREMADEASDTLVAELYELAKINPAFVGWVDRMVDLVGTITRPLEAIGQDQFSAPNEVCGQCAGAGKVDELRTCFVCAGSGFAEDLSTLQLMA